jgi:hypothetical protein
MKPHRGTLILVLAIVGIILCPFTGIAAWLMAVNDLKEMDAGLMDPAGREQTKAGKIIGIIATVLFVLFMIAGAIGLVFALWFGTTFQKQ